MDRSGGNKSKWSLHVFRNLPIDDIVKIIETHLSIVVIASDLVFKFKKPVHYSFVDYSTFARRWQAAVNEVYLNRRLTKDVYLGVRLVQNVSGNMCWQGDLIANPQESPPQLDAVDADVAVVMKLLNQEASLLNLINQGHVSNGDIASLALRLRDFHAGTQVKDIDLGGYLSDLDRNIDDNFKSIEDPKLSQALGEPYSSILIRGREYSSRFLRHNSETLRKRAESGFVVDGHGDLRLEHIIFERPGAWQAPQIQIFDCIEFNQEIRRNDIASEIGFLSMDLEFRNRRDLAGILERSYFKSEYTPELGELLSFFKHYRAMVRAKVHGLRYFQLENDSNEGIAELEKCRNYLSLGATYACGFDQPKLIILCGLTGTGKSSLAQALRPWLYAQVQNSDIVRKLNFKVDANIARLQNYGTGIYSQAATEATYEELFTIADQNLRYGSTVIIDASFIERCHREHALRIARKMGVPFIIIECKLNREETVARLNRRLVAGGSISDGRPEILEAQMCRWQAISADESDLYLQLDMSQSSAGLAEEVVRQLIDFNFKKRDRD